MQAASTILDHHRRIKRAVLHINRNLGHHCRLDRLADRACFSPFHFIRVFESLMGESPKQYTVRKRMIFAGFYLLKRKLRITDIALSVGYETPSSFCKAFKSHYGMTPRRFRDTVSDDFLSMTNPIYLSYNKPRISSGVYLGPLPVIQSFPPLTVLCMENRGIRNGSFVASAMASFKRLNKLFAARGLGEHVHSFVSIYPHRVFSTEDERAVNYIGAIVEGIAEPVEGLLTFVYPAGRYAIFKHYGPSEFIMHTWNQAYANWLPDSGRYLRKCPPFEIHLDVTSIVDNLQLSTYLLIPID
jgi:AraC family transcriptional regulator